MKVKEDIAKWRDELVKLKNQVGLLCSSTDEFSKNVKILQDMMSNLIKINEEITECLMALIKQQMGD